MIVLWDNRARLGVLVGLLLISGTLLGCTKNAGSPPVSLEDKIGQMLMVGFRGKAATEDSFIVRDIRRYNLGGVILFDYDVLTQRAERNIASPEQVHSLVSDLRAAARMPLLVAVDQEGGRVARLKTVYGFPATVSHGNLGMLDDPTITGKRGSAMAETLAALGINLNLAPVVDLCSHPDNPVIAKLDRCFSADPEAVTRHALAFIEAHRRQGVLTALKHFPGHGSSRTDSHLGFTDVSGTWTPAELEPFIRIIAAGQADMVMTAHVFNEQLDNRYPATLSPATITGLLRNNLGFDGVVISDDMQMGAIVAHYGFEDAIRLALEAGIDILVFGNNLDYDEQIVPRTIAAIQQLVTTGVISEARIDQSWQRIRRLKNLPD